MNTRPALIVLTAFMLCHVNMTYGDERISRESAFCKPVAVNLERGLLKSAFVSVNKNSNCWVESICISVAAFTPTQYSQFVKVAREESVEMNERERKIRPTGSIHFMQFTNESNSAKAFSCLEQKGESSSAETQFELFQIIRSSPQKPPTDANKWLSLAANSGDARAEYEIALLIVRYFGHGSSVPKAVVGDLSRDRYETHLEKAAQGGVPEAQYDLARLYAGELTNVFGEYPPRIYDAIRWLERSVTSPGRLYHNDYTMLSAAKLGHIYFYGVLVPPNFENAFRWYSRVDMSQVDPCSPLATVRHNLIQMYEQGLGVYKNIDKAKELARVASVCH